MPFLRTFPLLLFLNACGLLSGLTPERAAVNSLLRGGPDSRVKAGSITVLQSQKLGEQVLVLVMFQQFQDGRDVQCDFVVTTENTPRGWDVNSSAGGCSSTLGGPVGAGTGKATVSDGPGYSYAYGPAMAATQAVEVTWDDGQVQRIAPVNESYLAAREGSHETKDIVILTDLTDPKGLQDP